MTRTSGRRARAGAAATALTVGLMALSVAADAKPPPKPSRPTAVTASFASIGMPSGADLEGILEAQGWPASTVVTEGDSTYSWVRQDHRGPWVPEVAVTWARNFRATATGDVPPVAPTWFKITVGHIPTAVDAWEDSDRKQLIGGRGTVNDLVLTDDADTATARHGHAGSPRHVVTFQRVSPLAAVTTECQETAYGAMTDAQARSCSEGFANLLADRLDTRWSTLSKSWPDPGRPLWFPKLERLIDLRLTIAQVRAAGAKVRSVREREVPSWLALVRYRKPGSPSPLKTHGTHLLIGRYGDVAAAKAELRHRYKKARKRAVAVSPTSVTSRTRDGVTTDRRVGTGVIAFTCAYADTANRKAAIRCSQRLAAAQAKKMRKVFAPR